MSVNEPDIRTDRVNLDTIVSKIELLSRRMDQLETKTSANRERRSDDNIWSQLAASVTAIVGLREAVASKSIWMKCFWAVLLSCGICGSAYFIYQSGMQYLEYRSATNVNFFKNASYNFPPILLCSEEWMDPRKARATGLSIEAIKYSLGYFDDWHGLQVENATAAREEFASFYSDNRFQSLVDYYKSIAVQFDRAYESEEWAKMNTSGYFANMVETSLDAFYLITTGVCSLFRPNKADGVMSMSLIRNQIHIKTMMPQENPYYRPFPSWYIYYSRDDFLVSSIREYLSVPSNTAITITISAKRYLSMKNKGCVSSDEELDDHSALKCAEVCEENMYRRFLNCTNYSLMNLPKSHGLDGVCNLLDRRHNDTMTLSEYTYMRDVEHIHRNISAVCSEPCPERCERTYYDANVVMERSIADSESTSVADLLSSQNASAIIVTVMHTAVSEGGIMTYVEVSTYGFVDLVTDVGGSLGLFVGATVLTLIQMVVFLIGLIEKRWKKKTAM